MTQIRLAKELKSSKSTISGYELGDTSPSLETVAQLSDMADVPCDWIIKGRDDGGGVPPDESVLTPEESRLLESFRAINHLEQSAVLRIIEGLSRPRKTKQ